MSIRLTFCTRTQMFCYLACVHSSRKLCLSIRSHSYCVTWHANTVLASCAKVSDLTAALVRLNAGPVGTAALPLVANRYQAARTLPPSCGSNRGHI